MARKKMSIKEHNDLHKEVMEIQTELSNAQARFAEAEECEVVDNCPKCLGKCEVEDGYGDPAHNPGREMLYRECPLCEGKGYVDGTEEEMFNHDGTFKAGKCS